VRGSCISRQICCSVFECKGCYSTGTAFSLPILNISFHNQVERVRIVHAERSCTDKTIQKGLFHKCGAVVYLARYAVPCLNAKGAILQELHFLFQFSTFRSTTRWNVFALYLRKDHVLTRLSRKDYFISAGQLDISPDMLFCVWLHWVLFYGNRVFSFGYNIIIPLSGGICPHWACGQIMNWQGYPGRIIS